MSATSWASDKTSSKHKSHSNAESMRGVKKVVQSGDFMHTTLVSEVMWPQVWKKAVERHMRSFQAAILYLWNDIENAKT